MFYPRPWKKSGPQPKMWLKSWDPVNYKGQQPTLLFIFRIKGTDWLGEYVWSIYLEGYLLLQVEWKIIFSDSNDCNNNLDTSFKDTNWSQNNICMRARILLFFTFNDWFYPRKRKQLWELFGNCRVNNTVQCERNWLFYLQGKEA